MFKLFVLVSSKHVLLDKQLRLVVIVLIPTKIDVQLNLWCEIMEFSVRKL